jgi:flagellar biosynthetic protein FlhB
MAENGASSDSDDKTEAATPRRLQQARERGDVPLSQEALAAASFLSLALFAWLWLPGALASFTAALAGYLSHLAAVDTLPHPGLVIQSLVWTGAKLALPLIFFLAAAGVFATLLQTGFALRYTAILPDLGRLSLLAGWRRLFGVQGGIRAAKDAVKLLVLGLAFFSVYRHALAALGAALYWDPPALAAALGAALRRLLLVMALGQAMIAGADVLVVRFRFLRGLRMSRHEIKQEFKELEGNPQVKGRLRQLRRQRARRRMMAAVRKATLVVTNPTHYAVALRYDRARDAAPLVVAKGVDALAARIREEARAHRVPVLQNPPLARALYEVPLETPIPPEHYQAVAELIAYVWRLPGRRARQARF